MRGEARAFGEKKGNKGTAVCQVCMHRCHLEEGQYGRCQARKARDGRVVSASYGQVTALMLDPVEKKPLRHFYPGSRILSVGSFGCNLSCPFCQNHDISMKGEEAAARPLCRCWRRCSPGQTP